MPIQRIWLLWVHEMGFVWLTDALTGKKKHNGLVGNEGNGTGERNII